jgi:hypothetical protein
VSVLYNREVAFLISLMSRLEDVTIIVSIRS